MVTNGAIYVSFRKCILGCLRNSFMSKLKTHAKKLNHYDFITVTLNLCQKSFRCYL